MLKFVIALMASVFLLSCSKTDISPGKFTLVSKNPAVTGEMSFQQDKVDKTSYEFLFVNIAKTHSVLQFSTKIDSSGKAVYESDRSDRQQYTLNIQISNDTVIVKQDGMAGFEKDISYSGEYKRATK